MGRLLACVCVLTAAAHPSFEHALRPADTWWCKTHNPFLGTIPRTGPLARSPHPKACFSATIGYRAHSRVLRTDDQQGERTQFAVIMHVCVARNGVYRSRSSCANIYRVAYTHEHWGRCDREETTTTGAKRKNRTQPYKEELHSRLWRRRRRGRALRQNRARASYVVKQNPSSMPNKLYCAQCIQALLGASSSLKDGRILEDARSVGAFVPCMEESAL